MSEYYLSHTGSDLDEAINKVKNGYILPSETINVVKNISNMDITKGKILNVNVPVPDDYIKIDDTQICATKFASGTFSVTEDTQPSLVTIDTIGFKPKVFIMRTQTGFSTGPNTTNENSRYYINCSWYVVDSDYEQFLTKPDGNTETYTRHVTGFYSKSSGGYNLSSNYVNNSFIPTETGVKGNGATETTTYFKGNIVFFWYAWG